MKKGLIHVYTGDGKGKTTAALGLLLRAHGCGMRTVLVQFLKGRDTGELHALDNLRNVVILRHRYEFELYTSANEKEKAKMTRYNNADLQEAYRLASEGLCDLLVLDEICAAYNNSALDTELADKLILNKPHSVELVLTGRNAPQHFVDAADYMTEFVKRKHPYDRGITSRKGIEF